MRVNGKTKAISRSRREKQDKDQQAWIARLRTGDHQTFMEFRDSHEHLVYACCARQGLAGEALEDVVSDIFLAIYRGLRQFRGCAELTSWAWTIAYHESASYLRKKRRCLAMRSSPLPTSSLVADQTPADTIESRENRQRLHAALETLPQSWRTALQLFYWQGMSTVEIAEVMRVGTGVVRSYLFRGRRRLRQMLTRGSL